MAKSKKKSSEVNPVPDPPTDPSTAMNAGATLLGGEAAKAESRDWSNLQNDIFLEIQQGVGNIIIDATAGSGKTTTITHALTLIPPQASALLVAFNKKIAEELKLRVPQNVEAKTLHSHGLQTIKKYWALKRSSSMEEFKADSDARDGQMMVASGAPGPYELEDWKSEFYALKNLIMKCKFLLALDAAKIAEVQREYELLLGQDKQPESWMWRLDYVDEKKRPQFIIFTHKDIVEWVLAALRFSATEPKDGLISFSDMVFAPAVRPKMIPEQYDFVFVDETQDLSADQLALAIKSVKPNGRIVVVGDEHQCVEAGTMILTPTGERRADSMKAGDEIIGYRNGRNVKQIVRHAQPTAHEHGLRVTMKSGKTLLMSPNHKLWATEPDLLDHQFLVYLMYREDMGFRVGITNRGRKQNEPNPYGCRMRQEGAERIWVLKVCEDRFSALYWEEYCSLKFGVPTCVFTTAGRGVIAENVKKILQEFGANGQKVLDYKGLSFDYPHYLARNNERRGKDTAVVRIIGNSTKGTFVSVESSNPDLKKRLIDANVIVTKAKTVGWRCRKNFMSYRKALEFAEFVGGTIHSPVSECMTCDGRNMRLITAASLLVGMDLPIHNGEGIKTDKIVSIVKEGGSFIDLDVDDCSNFYGNGILTHNSIYSFKGADSKGMNRMEKELKAKRLPLSISYRVPQCAAREAKRVVPHFSVPDTAPEGVCSAVSGRYMISDWKNGDFVITRARYPMQSLAMLAITSGLYPLAIGEGDIAKSIRGIMNKAMKKSPSITTPKMLMRTVVPIVRELIEQVQKNEKIKRATWEKKYQLTAEELEEIPAVVVLQNTQEALRVLSEKYDNMKDFFAFVDSISMTDEQAEGMSETQKKSAMAGRLVISTVHGIKGAETNRTWVLEETFKFNTGGLAPKAKMNARQIQEEKNLWYVAVTRCKNEKNKPGELYYVRRLAEILGGVPDYNA